jgi:hypothetical protein
MWPQLSGWACFNRSIDYTSRTGSQTRRILWTNCLLLKCTVSHWITARVSMALIGRGPRPAFFVLGIHFRIAPRGAPCLSDFKARQSRAEGQPFGQMLEAGGLLQQAAKACPKGTILEREKT